MTQAIQKVLDISANIDQTVAASIGRNSYDRATIDQKCNTWNWGVLSPGYGGTNTTNAYNNLFTVGPWRAVWALSDGTMGTSQSSRKVKQDFLKPDITLEQMRSVDWTLYRFIDDVNLNGDSATIHVGMIAEELDDNVGCSSSSIMMITSRAASTIRCWACGRYTKPISPMAVSTSLRNV